MTITQEGNLDAAAMSIIGARNAIDAYNAGHNPAPALLVANSVQELVETATEVVNRTPAQASKLLEFVISKLAVFVKIGDKVAMVGALD